MNKDIDAGFLPRLASRLPGPLKRLRARPARESAADESIGTVNIGYANTFHDPAIAFSHEDRIFAEAFERSSQLKRALWMPSLFYAISGLEKNLRNLGFPVAEPARLVVRTTWKTNIFFSLLSAVAHLFQKLAVPHSKCCDEEEAFLCQQRSELSQVGLSQIQYLKALPQFTHTLKYDLWQGRPTSFQLLPTRHYITHAANAVYTSPFEECAVMIIDGSGEYHSSAFYHFKDNRFTPIATWPIYFSLGFFYAAMTRYCGFSPFHGEEWKVMGLAPYGRYRPELYEFFQTLVEVRGMQIHYKRNLHRAAGFHEPLREIVGEFRDPGDPDILKSADLAYNFQKFFTDIVTEVAQNFYELGLSENLVYGGGCALNSSTNGHIVSSTGFKRLHVPSSPGDDGNALGAVLYQKYHEDGDPRPARTMSPYLGAPVDLENLEQFLGFGGVAAEKCSGDGDLTEKTAELLADGAIIGWMQGRAEFGPRALGNRSILADPRREDMKDRINARVKFREGFRPFAPSILHEKGPDYFEDYQFSPYMASTQTFREEVRYKLPAVVHEDGTGRLQSVTRDMNPLFHELIGKFDARTGVPVLLNTSLNVMGRPIVGSESDALTMFMTSGLDHLVIGPYILSR